MEIEHGEDICTYFLFFDLNHPPSEGMRSYAADASSLFVMYMRILGVAYV